MKYLTPPDKIFNVNYLEQEDPDTGKKLLKSYDTDIKLYIFEDILDGENYNPNEILNSYKNKIYDYFIECLYFMNSILDFKLYYIEKILNDYDLTLYLPQGMSLKDLYDMRDKNQINKILKDHLVCSSDIIANSIPVIRLGFNIKKKSSNKILKLYFFDCSIYITLDENGKPWKPIQSLPIEFPFPSQVNIRDVAIECSKNLYFINIFYVIRELNELIHYGTNKYLNYPIQLPYRTLNRYYKVNKSLFRINYVKKLIENINYNKPENYISVLFLIDDTIQNTHYLNSKIKSYLNNQYFPNDDGTESNKLLIEPNNVFSIKEMDISQYITKYKKFNKKIRI